MRPMNPSNVLDLNPWEDGIVMLPPTCILRSYQLVEEEITTKKRSNTATTMIERVSVDYANVISSSKQLWVLDDSFPKLEMKDVIQVKFVDDYLNEMKFIREKVEKKNLVPLYHYTMPGFFFSFFLFFFFFFFL